MVDDNDVVFLDARKTSIAPLGGTLSGTPASEHDASVIHNILQRNNISTALIDEVSTCQVLTAGCGQNPARQVAIFSALSESVSALTINKVCSSGFKSLELAFQAIRCGDAELIIAGGQEAMSMASHVLPRSCRGVKLGDWNMPDSAIADNSDSCRHKGVETRVGVLFQGIISANTFYKTVTQFCLGKSASFFGWSHSSSCFYLPLGHS